MSERASSRAPLCRPLFFLLPPLFFLSRRSLPLAGRSQVGASHFVVGGGRWGGAAQRPSAGRAFPPRALFSFPTWPPSLGQGCKMSLSESPRFTHPPPSFVFIPCGLSWYSRGRGGRGENCPKAEGRRHFGEREGGAASSTWRLPRGGFSFGRAHFFAGGGKCAA